MSKAIVSVAIESFSWIWDSSGLSIKKCHSLVEIWAVLKFVLIKSFSTCIFIWNVQWWLSCWWWSTWSSFKLKNHIVCWINDCIIFGSLRSCSCWHWNLSIRSNTAVSWSEAVEWDIIWSSWVIGINFGRLPVIFWPWIEVWKWSSFSFSFSLNNHIICWINDCIIFGSLRSCSCWHWNLSVRGNTAVSWGEAMEWNVVWCSGIISINFSWFPVVLWPWVEVRKRSCHTLWVNLGNHVISWVDDWLGSGSLRSSGCWHWHLSIGCDTTVAWGKAVEWNIVRSSGVIGINFGGLPVISWPWIEVGKWCGLVSMVMVVPVSKSQTGTCPN